MRITVYSHFADFGDESPVWSGEVEIPMGADRDAFLDNVYRFFNRVDDADNERLDDIGYNLPSLSSGDTVMFDGKVFYCAPVGWQQVGKPKITIEEIEDLF